MRLRALVPGISPGRSTPVRGARSLRGAATSRLRGAAIALALVAGAAAGCTNSQHASTIVGPGADDTPNLSVPSLTGGPVTPLPPLPPVDPVELRIESIRAVSSLIPLGLNPDRTVAVPSVSRPMQASWYRLGPAPGAAGAAVILGHADGNGRPGIFARLNQTKPGDLVTITRKDGTRAIFTITRLQRVAKDSLPTEFPTEAIQGDLPGNIAELRLVTCDGFDRGARGNRDNIIAYATLTGVA